MTPFVSYLRFIRKSFLVDMFLYFLFIGLLFFFIYNPNFCLLGSGFTRYVFVFLLLLNLPFLYAELKGAITSKDILSLLAYFLLLFVSSLLVSVAHQSYDFNVAITFITIVVVSLPITYLTTGFLVKRTDADFDTVLLLISITVFLQSLLILAEWFVPAIRSLLNALIVKRMETLIRASGLSSFEGDGLSFIQATGAMITFYLTRFSRYGSRYKPVLFIILFFQVASIVFTARTGLVLLALFIMLIILFNKNRMRHIRKMFFLVLISLVLAYGLYALIIPPDAREMIETKLLPWAFEYGYNYLESGTLATSSTTEIFSEMLFLPDNDSTLLFGDGFYLDPLDNAANYVTSDSGYVRTIYFSGLLGSAILYIFFIFLMFLFKKYALDAKRFSFCSAFIIVLFVAQIKLPFLYYVLTYNVLLLFLFTLYFERKREKGAKKDQVARTIGDGPLQLSAL